MGGGDGKLAAAVGANLLLPLWLHSFVYAIAARHAARSIAMLAVTRRRLGQRTAIPFGPAMALGALLALFFGPAVWNWYVQHYLTFPGSSFAPAGMPAKNN